MNINDNVDTPNVKAGQQQQSQQREKEIERGREEEREKERKKTTSHHLRSSEASR